MADNATNKEKEESLNARFVVTYDKDHPVLNTIAAPIGMVFSTETERTYDEDGETIIDKVGDDGKPVKFTRCTLLVNRTAANLVTNGGAAAIGGATMGRLFYDPLNNKEVDAFFNAINPDAWAELKASAKAAGVAKVFSKQAKKAAKSLASEPQIEG